MGRISTVEGKVTPYTPNLKKWNDKQSKRNCVREGTLVIILGFLFQLGMVFVCIKLLSLGCEVCITRVFLYCLSCVVFLSRDVVLCVLLAEALW